MNPVVSQSLYRPRQSRFAAQYSLVASAFFAASLILPSTVLGQGQAPVERVAMEDVVQMDAFTVSTAIGSYREETSGMATKVPMNMKELASSLQILNATAITDRNAISLQDVFSYVVGATQNQTHINGFTFRGFTNGGTFTQNIEFDGLQGATLKKGASSSANVERLEFLKGPNSVLYGQMKPGGLLNIVTKSPQETKAASLRVSFGTYAGFGGDPGDKLLGTASLDLTGPIDNDARWLYRTVLDVASTPTSRPGNFARSISFYPSLTYRWNPETSLTIKLETSQDNRRQDDGLIPIFTSPTAVGSGAAWYTAPYDTVYQDPKCEARDKGAAAAVNFQALLPGEWTYRFASRSVWHADFTNEFSINNKSVYTPKANYATPTTTLKRQFNRQQNGHRYNFFDTNLYRTFETGKIKHTLLLGVGGGHEVSMNERFAFGPNDTVAITLINPILNQTAYPAVGSGVQSQRNYLTTFGEYVSDQIKIGDRFNVSLGLRHDQQNGHGIDVYKPKTTPYAEQHVKSTVGQAGLVYAITSQLSTYASWSQSVIPNSVVIVDDRGQSGFPAEKGRQYEVGVKFESTNRNFFTSMAAYDISRTNVAVNTATTIPAGQPKAGQGIFRLDGEQRSEGVELEAQWQPKPHWQLQGGVAYNKAYVRSSSLKPVSVGRDLAGAPRATASFWTRYNVPTGGLKGLGVGTGVVYTGKSWGGDPAGEPYYAIPGWTRVDLAIYYKWRKSYDLAINVANLLDRKYIMGAQSAYTLNPSETRKITFMATKRF
ncbi:MAG: TonB-dependent receptor [Opitutaceae bacterium]|nr:TonB-dependent receptor [Opitutaceae bacterium]